LHCLFIWIKTSLKKNIEHNLFYSKTILLCFFPLQPITLSTVSQPLISLETSCFLIITKILISFIMLYIINFSFNWSFILAKPLTCQNYPQDIFSPSTLKTPNCHLNQPISTKITKWHHLGWRGRLENSNFLSCIFLLWWRHGRNGWRTLMIIIIIFYLIVKKRVQIRNLNTFLNNTLLTTFKYFLPFHKKNFSSSLSKKFPPF